MRSICLSCFISLFSFVSLFLYKSWWITMNIYKARKMIWRRCMLKTFVGDRSQILIFLFLTVALRRWGDELKYEEVERIRTDGNGNGKDAKGGSRIVVLFLSWYSAHVAAAAWRIFTLSGLLGIRSRLRDCHIDISADWSNVGLRNLLFCLVRGKPNLDPTGHEIDSVYAVFHSFLS